MSEAPRLRDLIPRRSDGLPPGQREVRTFPRFSDKPLRWAPKPAPVELTISVEGAVMQTFSTADLEKFDRVEQVSDFHCVTIWTHRDLRWGGVRFRDVARSAVGDELPAYGVAHASDGQSAIFVTEDLLGDDVLLATELDGGPLVSSAPGSTGTRTPSTSLASTSVLRNRHRHSGRRNTSAVGSHSKNATPSCRTGRFESPID